MSQSGYFLSPSNQYQGLSGWTVNKDGTSWTNTGGNFMEQVRPSADFVGPMPAQGLENFSGLSGDLNGQQFTLNEAGGMGNLGGYLAAGAGILQGLGGLASAFTAYKGLQLAKDQFKFQKGLANRNLANQSKVINNAYDNAAQVAAGMIGGGSYSPATDSQGSYGMTDQAIVDQYAAKAKEKHVDGSAI